MEKNDPARHLDASAAPLTHLNSIFEVSHWFDQ